MTDTIIGLDVGKTSSVQQFPLGTQTQVGSLKYEYVKATAALTAGLLCGIIEDGTIAAGITYAVGGSGAIPTPVGVPQVDFANGDYGWIVRSGANFKLSCAASCAKDVKLYTTATAGVVDDASASQSIIPGLRINTTITSAAVVSDASASIDMAIN